MCKIRQLIGILKKNGCLPNKLSIIKLIPKKVQNVNRQVTIEKTVESTKYFATCKINTFISLDAFIDELYIILNNM